VQRIPSNQLDLSNYLRNGDAIIIGQAAAEPQTLTQALVAQRHQLGPLKLFLGVGLTNTFLSEHRDTFTLTGFGASVTHRSLIESGGMEIISSHFSALPELIRNDTLACDVVMLQVSLPNAQGQYSYSLSNDYLQAAISKARVVIAEINHLAPQTPCDCPLNESDIHFAIESQHPLIEVPPAPHSAVAQKIAIHIAKLIADRATLQMGIGAVPEALLLQLKTHQGLGIHSGMLNDNFVDLVTCGAITNAYKEIDPGVSIAGVLIGTQKLYAFANQNPALRLCNSDYTHSQSTLAQLKRFYSINSALEVDLTGQVNSETLGRQYIGNVGGQVDFVRASANSQGGYSIIALPSTTQKGKNSRIVYRLTGPVTTARTDVDIVVTEHGYARLKGKTLEQRVKSMITIAEPAHQESLMKQVYENGIY